MCFIGKWRAKFAIVRFPSNICKTCMLQAAKFNLWYLLVALTIQNKIIHNPRRPWIKQFLVFTWETWICAIWLAKKHSGFNEKVPSTVHSLIDHQKIFITELLRYCFWDMTSEMCKNISDFRYLKIKSPIIFWKKVGLR